MGVDSWRAVGKISTCPGDVAQLGERCPSHGSRPRVRLPSSPPLDLISRRHCVGGFFERKGCTMAELESQPLSDEERAELEELRAEKARREAQEEARREREELAALRAERAKADEAAAKAASEPAPAASKPQPKKVARPKPVDSKPSRDEMTFAQRMVTSKETCGRGRYPRHAAGSKLIIALALIGLSSLWATRSRAAWGCTNRTAPGAPLAYSAPPNPQPLYNIFERSPPWL